MMPFFSLKKYCAHIGIKLFYLDFSDFLFVIEGWWEGKDNPKYKKIDPLRLGAQVLVYQNKMFISLH